MDPIFGSPAKRGHLIHARGNRKDQVAVLMVWGRSGATADFKRSVAKVIGFDPPSSAVPTQDAKYPSIKIQAK